MISGIVCLIHCIELFPLFIYYMISWVGAGTQGGYVMDYLIKTIMNLAVYSIGFILLFRNSKKFAEALCDRAQFSADVNLSIRKEEMLFGLFTGLGIFGLITTVPQLLSDIYRHIQNSNKFLSDEAVKPTMPFIVEQAIKAGLFFALVYYANVFAAFAASKVKNIEPPDAINEQSL
jgi:uncharacterized membrane protein